MQNQIIRKKEYRGTFSLLGKAFSTLLAMLGALVLTLLILKSAVSTAAEWSPTQTARKCFYFPEKITLPDRESTVQLLMSASFFGSDALYFDEGEENTGLTEPYTPSTSESEGKDSPPNPIGEPTAPNQGNQSVDEATNIYDFDRSLVPNGELALFPYDLTLNSKIGEILLSNTTGYKIDTTEFLTREYPIKASLDDYSQSEPLVLIIHTHGTEAYSPSGAVSTPASAVQRSSDTSKNMIAVGKVMSDLLNGAGIPTIHCETMHDLESYTRSYNLAADTIQKYLKKYPSIKYVFDVHRDAIVRTNGDLIRPITVINGEIAAQVMLLVGTNEAGADHPDWEDNMTVATHLQHRLTLSYTRFARPINIRTASFNEQFTKGSLLIEIGSAANSLEEAKTAAKYLTYSIIDMIKDNEK